MRATLRLLGLALMILGIGLWVGTGRSAVTALIPAFFGAVFVLLATAAARPGTAASALNGGFLLSIVGAAGGLVRGTPGALAILRGEAIERPAAIWGQVAMGLLCLAYAIYALMKKKAAD